MEDHELDDLLAGLRPGVGREMAATARPAVRYGVAEAHTTTSRSHLGGLPSLPADIDWPSWRRPSGDTVSLSFFAQLDLADGVALDLPLPAEGLLLLFADFRAEEDAGILGIWQEEHDGATAIHVADDHAARPAPQGAITYSHVDLVPVHCTSLLAPTDEGLTGQEWDAIDDIAAALRARVADVLPAGVRMGGHHQLGGHAPWIQNPVEEEVLQCAAGIMRMDAPAEFDKARWESIRPQVTQWRTVFTLDCSEIDTDPLWEIYGTTLYWAARASDLAAGRFHEVWFNSQR